MITFDLCLILKLNQIYLSLRPESENLENHIFQNMMTGCVNNYRGYVHQLLIHLYFCYTYDKALKGSMVQLKQINYN